MAKPLISIIVPVYNSQKFIEECVRSVISQSYSNWELILIDDGSIDQSPLICDSFSSKYENIKVFHQKNSGQLAAREKGIKISSGDYLIFLDSDDFLEHNTIEILTKELMYTNYDLIMYDSYHVDENGSRTLGKDSIGFCHSTLEIEEIIKYCFLKKNSRISMCAYCFSRKVIETGLKNYLFVSNTKSQEDFLMAYSIIRNANSLRIIDSVLYNYRQHSDSTSHSLDFDNFYKGLEVSSVIYHDILSRFQNISKNDFDAYVVSRLSWLPLSYIIRCLKSQDKTLIKKRRKVIKADFLYSEFTKHFNFGLNKYGLVFFLFRINWLFLARKVANTI